MISELRSAWYRLTSSALLVYNWRKKIIELLSSPVEAQDENLPNVGQGQDVENPDNEFYAEALKAQGDVEAYLIAYAAAVADRRG
jgi:E3 ubiquitin-protein ligase SHPRH